MPLPRLATGVAQQRYEDPLGEMVSIEDLEVHVRSLLQFKKFLSDNQRDRLITAFLPEVKQTSVELGGGFDIIDEVQQQIVAVRAIRNELIDKQGRIREGFSPREANTAFSAGNSLLQLLTKYQKDLINMGRLRKLESAVIDVLREEDPELHQRVLRRFDEKLAVV